MEKLNTTSEWERVVNENHKRAEDAAFEADLKTVKAILRKGPGADRSEFGKRYHYSRLQKLTMSLLAIVNIISIIVILNARSVIPEAAMPAAMVSLLLAGFMIGWHACAAIIGKGK